MLHPFQSGNLEIDGINIDCPSRQLAEVSQNNMTTFSERIYINST